nr:ATPase [Cryptococcus depauperatus CBS 7855]
MHLHQPNYRNDTGNGSPKEEANAQNYPPQPYSHTSSQSLTASSDRPSTVTISPIPIVKIHLRAPNTPEDSTEMVSGRISRRSSQAHQEEPVSSRPQRDSKRRAIEMIYEEEDEELDDAYGEPEGDAGGDDDGDFEVLTHTTTTRSGRAHKPPIRYEENLDFKPVVSPEAQNAARPTRGRTKRRIIADPDEDEDDNEPHPSGNAFPSRINGIKADSFIMANPADHDEEHETQLFANGVSASGRPRRNSTRLATRLRHSSADAEEFEPTDDDTPSEDHASSDALGNYDEADDFVVDDDEGGYSKRRSSRRTTRSSARPSRSNVIPTRRSTRSSAKARMEDTDEDLPHKRPNLRTRTSRPNYHIPTMDDLSKDISMQEAMAAVSRPNGRAGGGLRGIGGVRFGGTGLPFGMRGKNLTQAMGDPDTSDSDDFDFASPLKSGAAGPSMSGNNVVAARGTGGPSDVPNYGRINPKSTMADADPLGVDINVTFDNVGGLDNHINQLKEMVALPLLYPEVFQQFSITPPRGVLFHGPPGTGKTLLARALAASCSTGNTKISFFMRKGADVLSKWVGEAERQLRMLFEEARASQPSIIFFDEIDGLAPVRSSKQDQIHASLVSTLLALMDGMDGRGQVIVIGATNRPDAVDPALRRPGRFDREFYFPLPNREARKKIISINTRHWEPKLSNDVLERLATMTKGYGGADLRALCTEAALNAIQRRYPQIYKTTDRLELQTKSIQVQAKDFMMSAKKIVPSSARSATSPAIQLPSHLAPLLTAPLERLQAAVDHILPPRKRLTALEEAEFEEEDGDGFEKHMMLQSLDKMRTFRPRILVHGRPGMGQAYLGPAVLHHLEGFHVQSLDLGVLLSDPTRSVEAAIVQLFVEAKRHQPSVIFIPSLSQWASNIPDLARSTFEALLNSVPPSDPILLLGMIDGPINELPGDVRAWFGFAPENKIELDLPTVTERSAYFTDLVSTVRKPPTHFPDGVPRRKRLLEALPLAAPLPPRQPTESELAREEEKDQAARNMMIVSFTNLIQEFMKRYRKVVASDDAMELSNYLAGQAAAPSIPTDHLVQPLEICKQAAEGVEGPQVNGDQMEVDVVPPEAEPTIVSSLPGPTEEPSHPTTPPIVWQAHNIDIDTLQRKLIRHKYFTPNDFLADIYKIEENASKLRDPERQAKVVEMSANAKLHVSGFDPKWTPEFERYAERMRAKKAERQKRKEQQGKEKEQAKRNEEKPKEDVTAEIASPVAKGEQNELLVETPVDEKSIETVASTKRLREESDEVNSQGREKRLREGSDPTEPSQHVNLDTLATIPPPQLIMPPSPVYPSFVVPEQDMLALQLSLVAETNSLTIDQLEQLRATLFDKLWSDRTKWDRTETISNMRQRLKEYVAEVEEWKKREIGVYDNVANRCRNRSFSHPLA